LGIKHVYIIKKSQTSFILRKKTQLRLQANPNPNSPEGSRSVMLEKYIGMTLRDGMGREVGGGFRMGNTCTPMADSRQCMAKPTTIL